jgi:hypothetical protein
LDITEHYVAANHQLLEVMGEFEFIQELLDLIIEDYLLLRKYIRRHFEDDTRQK